MVHITKKKITSHLVRKCTLILFVFGATAASGPGPPHSRGF